MVEALQCHPFFEKLGLQICSYEANKPFYLYDGFARCLLCDSILTMGEVCYEFRVISPLAPESRLIYYTHKDCADKILKEARLRGREEAAIKRKIATTNAVGKAKTYNKPKGYITTAWKEYMKGNTP